MNDKFCDLVCEGGGIKGIALLGAIYYLNEQGYEFKKSGDFIEVNVFDLPKGSSVKVKVVCDICGKKSEIQYNTVFKCNKENKLITCGDKICSYKKCEDTCMKKYGVKSINQLKTVKDKKINAYRKKYGVDSPGQAQEVREKIKNTNLKKYGNENPFGSKEIQDKIKATWQKNYGEDIENPFQVESVKEKSKQTMLNSSVLEKAYKKNEKYFNSIRDSFSLNEISE